MYQAKRPVLPVENIRLLLQSEMGSILAMGGDYQKMEISMKKTMGRLRVIASSTHRLELTIFVDGCCWVHYECDGVADSFCYMNHVQDNLYEAAKHLESLWEDVR